MTNLELCSLPPTAETALAHNLLRFDQALVLYRLEPARPWAIEAIDRLIRLGNTVASLQLSGFERPTASLAAEIVSRGIVENERSGSIVNAAQISALSGSIGGPGVAGRTSVSAVHQRGIIDRIHAAVMVSRNAGSALRRHPAAQEHDGIVASRRHADPVGLTEGLADLERCCCQEERSGHPVVRAGMLYAQFRSVAAYSTGNGIVARILAHRALAQSDLACLPLDMIVRDNLAPCRRALNLSIDRADPTVWLQYFTETAVRSVQQRRRMLKEVQVFATAMDQLLAKEFDDDELDETSRLDFVCRLAMQPVSVRKLWVHGAMGEPQTDRAIQVLSNAGYAARFDGNSGDEVLVIEPILNLAKDLHPMPIADFPAVLRADPKSRRGSVPQTGTR